MWWTSGPLMAEIRRRLWGTQSNFDGFRVLAALLHGTLVVGVSQTLCGIEQRAPAIFDRAAITLGIGPRSSSSCYGQLAVMSHCYWVVTCTTMSQSWRTACTFYPTVTSVCATIGSRPSDHYFRSVCLFVCAEFFSAVFDPISIKLKHVICLGLVVSRRI